jgi:hypothetical protein
MNQLFKKNISIEGEGGPKYKSCGSISYKKR